MQAIRQNEIKALVSDTLKEILQVYFNINNCEELMDSGKFAPANSIICKTVFRDHAEQGVVYMSFDKLFLTKLAKIINPLDSFLEEDGRESCATEITNIICARIKAYLNDLGFNADMDIPEVTDNFGKTDIHISFIIEHDTLHIDIGFSDPIKISP